MSPRHTQVPRDRFIEAVHHIIQDGDYPSGARINKRLCRSGRYLAPIECQWRREAAGEAGITLNGSNLDGSKGRQRPPIVKRDPSGRGVG